MGENRILVPCGSKDQDRLSPSRARNHVEELVKMQIPGPCSQRCCLVCVGRGPGTMSLDDRVIVRRVEQPLGSRQCRCVSSPGPELSHWFLEVLTHLVEPLRTLQRALVG